MFAQGRPARPAEPCQGRCLVSRWLWLRGSSNSRKASRPPSLSPCRCPLQKTPSAACADDRAREITSFLSSLQTSKQAQLVEAGELAQLGPGAGEPWGLGGAPAVSSPTGSETKEGWARPRHTKKSREYRSGLPETSSVPGAAEPPCWARSDAWTAEVQTEPRIRPRAQVSEVRQGTLTGVIHTVYGDVGSGKELQIRSGRSPPFPKGGSSSYVWGQVYVLKGHGPGSTPPALQEASWAVEQTGPQHVPLRSPALSSSPSPGDMLLRAAAL